MDVELRKRTVKSGTPVKARFIPHEEISSPRPILCEPLSLLEFATLRFSPVYYGMGVPEGDGSAVVMIPCLLGADFFLFELYAWLARIGYRPSFSGMGIINDCPDLLARRLAATIRRAYTDTGRRVHLIGHSLGGVFARSAAVRMPDRIASVITMGTPFRGLVVHGIVLALANFLRRRIRVQYGHLPEHCATSRCTCAFGRSLRRQWPQSVAQTAIYTQEDGVVDWRYCVTGRSKVDIEVHGTHIGLIFNSAAYMYIAKCLAVSQKSTGPGEHRRQAQVRTGIPSRARSPIAFRQARYPSRELGTSPATSTGPPGGP